MSKKQFDDMDDKIREAAENNQPPYQEVAWDKMNALLDKSNSKKRVPVWWIPLLVLLLGGGAYLYFTKSSAPQNEKNLTASEENNKNAVTPPAEQVKTPGLKEAETGTEKEQAVKPQAEKNKSNDNAGTDQYKKDNNIITAKQKTISIKPRTAKVFSKKGKMKTQTQFEIASQEEQKENTDETKPADIKEDGAGNIEKIKQTEQVINNPVINETVAQKDSLAATEKQKDKHPPVTKQTKTANSNSKTSRFYLLATLGAEAASTKFLSFVNSKFAPAYGIGIGYRLTKKLSIQTGFYAGQKKYIAGHKDYHPKPGSYWNDYDVYIKKVDANCMVYEIPLSVRYSFIQKPATEYFVTAGASTYVMKKEDYTYDYMRNYIPYSGRYIYTGNKHLFSVLTFSAGIDKRLSQNFSLLAGPTFGIPISGVGEGTVKLFTAGIMAGIKYQPSSKK